MATPAQLLPHVDELVMEYLLFRGFTKSFQALAAERKRDRTKAFDVEQIISQLLTFVQTYQIEPLLDTWKFLEARFFNRLDASHTPTIRELKDSWLRLYVVNAIKNGQRDKAIEFFRLLADKLNASVPITSSSSSQDSWHRWFILPYMQSPERDPHFRSFFTKQWLESFVTSFRNFLSLIFRNLPLPKLLAFQISRLEEPSAKLRLKTSQSECNRLRSSNAQATERIHKLEDAGHQLYRIVQTMVQHTFAEHFSGTDAARSPSGPVLGDGSVSSASMKTLVTLSDQLRDLHEIFGPSAATSSSSQVGTELEAVFLNPPLKVKLNPVDTTPQIADEEMTPTAIELFSSQSRVKTEPELVETTVFSDDVLDGETKAICAYVHDGKRLSVSQIGSHKISIFDVDAEGSTSLRNVIRTESDVVGVDWMADSQCLIFALQDGTINVWDSESTARTFTMSYNSDERRPTHLACAPSKAIGALTLVGGSPAVEGGASLSSCIQFFTLKDHAMRVLSSVELDEGLGIVSLRWASDGSVLAVCSSDGRVAFVSPSTQRAPRTCRLPGDANQVESLALTPHGQSLLLCQLQSSESDGNDAYTVSEWSLKGVMAATASPPLIQYRLFEEIEMTPADGITAAPHLDIKASGSMFVVSRSSSENSAFVLLTRGQCDPVTYVVRVPCQIKAMAWHPHGRFLIAATCEGKLLTWKIAE